MAASKHEQDVAGESSDKSTTGPQPEDPQDLEKQTTRQSVWLSDTFTPGREAMFVILMCMTQLLTQAAFGQVLFTNQAIGRDIGTSSPGQESWLVAAFSLTVGTFVLPAGRLGDMYGHKLMAIIGWTWFGLCSIITGLAVFVPKGQGAVIMLCLFQGLRGLGPALLLPNSLAILGRTYPFGRRKDMVFSMFAMCAPTGAVLGGVFGSIFAQLVWWPWLFWSIGITQLCIAVVAAMIVPADDKRARANEKFDLIGGTLGVSGMILFNFAWNQAGVVGWQDPYVPTLLAVGVLLIVVFVLYERRIEQPILPPDVFNFGSSITLLVVSLGWASFGVFIYYGVLFIQNIRGYSLLSTIAQESPIAVSGVIAAVSTGLLISRVPSHWMMCASAAAFTIGVILLATQGVHQTYWAQTFVAFVILPFGMDISFPAAALILSNLVPKRLQGVAASLVNTIVNYSISIGLGFAGTAERYVSLEGASLLHGYRVALYVGVGLAGGALVVAVCFAVYMQFWILRKGAGGERDSQIEQAAEAAD